MRFKWLAVCFVAVLALALPATQASAAKPKVWLTKNGQRAAVGSTMALQYFWIAEANAPEGDECFLSNFSGSLEKNGATTAKFNLPTYTQSCDTGYILKGKFASWAVTSNQHIIVTGSPKFVYGESDWCAYEFKKFEASYALSDEFEDLSATFTAKLDKAASLNPNCATTQSLEVLALKLGFRPGYTGVEVQA